ncbi:MAG: deoxyribonuclease IV [Pirellulaceae bacterium]|nr:deoxyribonuclease IV [Planctomycetales bacterium]
MPEFLGAHMSIAGGYYKAVEAAAACDMNCVQLFTKNNNQWRAKPITDDDVAAFREALEKTGVRRTISHASYLINMGSPEEGLRNQSIEAMVVELARATQLGIPHVVVHPGSYTTSTEEEGIARIAESLNEVHRQADPDGAMVLLENTAGQGSNLGWRFEQLAAMIDQVADPDRIGICFDTCHAHAAGYDMRTPETYEATMKELKAKVGLKRVLAFHLNDSKGDLGSRKDRHEHIGQGSLGLEPFRHLLNDKRFRRIPMYLETPKGDHEETTWDDINLATLRGLIDG